jgi:hypothetical protein
VGCTQLPPRSWDISLQSKPAAPSQPFVTRRSVAIAWAGSLVMVLIVGSSKATQNGQGLLIALGYGVLAACLLVAYVGAVILAIRARSVLLLLLVFVIPPPFGPLVCVLFTGTKPRARTGRP